MTVSGASGAATAAPFFGAMNTKLKAQTTTPTTGSGSTGDSSLSVNNLGTTFLSLLAQELQNQDPTSPMDPTAMVGQMISLNQLDQLISINQAVTPATGTTSATGTTPATSGNSGSGVTKDAQTAALDATGTLISSSAGSAAAGQAAAAAQAATNPASLSAAAAAAQNTTTPLNLETLTALRGGK